MATRKSSAAKPSFTAPGLDASKATKLNALLQDRLNALNDLALTLKHIHWNVVGTHFIGVHTMLDPQVDAVRLMVDETAERIAILGGSPVGTPGALVKARDWDDYSLGRDDALAHLAALDTVYVGLVSSHRDAIEASGELDDVTQDMLIGQTQQLELFQWFVRAHLEGTDGTLKSAGSRTERSAARTARKSA